MLSRRQSLWSRVGGGEAGMWSASHLPTSSATGISANRASSQVVEPARCRVDCVELDEGVDDDAGQFPVGFGIPPAAELLGHLAPDHDARASLHDEEPRTDHRLVLAERQGARGLVE